MPTAKGWTAADIKRLTGPAPGPPVPPAAQADVALVPNWLAKLDEVPHEQVAARFTVSGEPLGKLRPRFDGRTGRVYTPRSSKVHEQAIGMAALAARRGAAADAEWAYGVRAVFCVRGHHRKDVDNLLKSVLDGLNKRVFADDTQVQEVMGWKALDAQNPRTEVVVYRLYRIDKAARECVHCGKEFRVYLSWKLRLYCSRACFFKATKLAVEVPCAHCGKTLLRTPCQLEQCSKGETFCSRGCLSLHRRINVPCDCCGTLVSRPQSFIKTDQKRVFCSKQCQAKCQHKRSEKMTPEQMTAAAHKGWETRRRKHGK